MKKAKRICRNILIFILMIGLSMVPTVIFRTKDEINILFRQPGYWIITAGIALVLTWQIIQVIKKYKK